MKKKLPVWLLRVLIYLGMIGLITFLICLSLKSILPGFIKVIERGNQAEIEAYLRSFAGLRGMAIAFLLQFMQIVSVVFPGGPIQIAIGIVFGAFKGFLICHAGYLAASSLVFLSARKLGRGLAALLPLESERSGRFSKIRDAKRPASMVFLFSVLPFLPNGLVPYVAAKTRISFFRFFAAVYLGSLPALLFLCGVGNALVAGNFLFAGILVAVFLCAVVLLFVFRNRLEGFFENPGSGRR